MECETLYRAQGTPPKRYREKPGQNKGQPKPSRRENEDNGGRTTLFLLFFQRMTKEFIACPVPALSHLSRSLRSS